MKIHFRSPKIKDPERERGVRVPYASAKRAVSRWRWYFVVTLVSVPFLYLMGQILYTTLVVTASGFVTLEKVPVNSQMVGWLTEVSVRTGQEVNPGRLLATLANSELQQREQLLRAEAAASESASPVPSGAAALRELEMSLKLGQEVVDYHSKHLSKVRSLYNQGAATIAELNLAQSNLHRSEADLQQMRSSVALRRLEDLRLQVPDRHLETRAKLIQVELEALMEQQSRLIHRSPVHGRVLEVHAEAGQNLAQGQPILTLGNLGSVCIQAYLDARNLKHARPGVKAFAELRDGRRFRVVVRQGPELTGRLPAAAAPVLGERQFMLLVVLDFEEMLPPEDMVDNLPVTVRFPAAFPFFGR